MVVDEYEVVDPLFDSLDWELVHITRLLSLGWLVHHLIRQHLQFLTLVVAKESLFLEGLEWVEEALLSLDGLLILQHFL